MGVGTRTSSTAPMTLGAVPPSPFPCWLRQACRCGEVAVRGVAVGASRVDARGRTTANVVEVGGGGREAAVVVEGKGMVTQM
jgi:hypothetical protein